MRYFGLFGDFFFKCKLFKSKKTTTLKHVHDHDNFIHVYMNTLVNVYVDLVVFNGPAHSFPGEKVGRPILSPPSQFFPP